MGKATKGSPGRKLKPLPALTEVQLDELEQAAQSSAKPCVRRRAAIMRDLYAGLSIKQVARKNEQCCQTVRLWRERARIYGIEFLENAPRLKMNRPPSLPDIRTIEPKSCSAAAPVLRVKVGEQHILSASGPCPIPGRSWFQHYAPVRAQLEVFATRSSSPIDWLRSTMLLRAACERTGLSPDQLDEKFGPSINRLDLFKALDREARQIRRGTTKEGFEGQLDPIRLIDELPDLRGLLPVYDSLLWLVLKCAAGLDYQGCRTLLGVAFEIGGFWRPSGIIARHKQLELEQHLALAGTAPTEAVWAGSLEHLMEFSDRPLDRLALLILLQREAALALRPDIAKKRLESITAFLKEMSFWSSMSRIHHKLLDAVYKAMPAVDKLSLSQGAAFRDDPPWLISSLPVFLRTPGIEQWAARVERVPPKYDDRIVGRIWLRRAIRQASEFW